MYRQRGRRPGNRDWKHLLSLCYELRVVVDHQFDLGIVIEIPVLAIDFE